MNSLTLDATVVSPGDITGNVVVEGAQPVTESIFLSPSELCEEVDIDYAIDEIMVNGSITTLYGPKDCFKSFLVIDWGMSMACGLDWCGREVKQGAFFYICGEGRVGITRRLKAWCLHNGKDLEKVPVFVTRMPARIRDNAVVHSFIKEIPKLAKSLKVGVGMVCVDTLSSNFGDGNQNDPSDMAAFVANVKYILNMTNSTGVIVHHAGKDKSRGARGGSSIEMDVDQVYSLERLNNKEDLSPVELKCKHIKDSGRPEPLHLWPVVKEINEDKASLILRLKLSDRQKTILALSEKGVTQRQIAVEICRDKKVVSREVKRLKNMRALKK